MARCSLDNRKPAPPYHGRHHPPSCPFHQQRPFLALAIGIVSSAVPSGGTLMGDPVLPAVSRGSSAAQQLFSAKPNTMRARNGIPFSAQA